MRSPHGVSHDEDHADTEISEAELAQVRETCQAVRVSEIPHLSISSLEWDGLLLRLPASRMSCRRDFGQQTMFFSIAPGIKSLCPIGRLVTGLGFGSRLPKPLELQELHSLTLLEPLLRLTLQTF